MNNIEKSKELWKNLNNDTIRNETINNILPINILPINILPINIHKKDNKIIMVTYADDRGNRKNGLYKHTQDKITEALKLHPDIKYIHPLTEKHLFSTLLYKNYKSIYSNGPLHTSGVGNGFKPYFLLQVLSELDDGSFLLYHDVSPEIWDFKYDYTKYSLQNLINLCEKNSGILMSQWYDPKHTHSRYTNKECLSIMNLEYLKNNSMGCSSWLLVQKTSYTTNIIKEWLYWMLFPECAAVYQTDDNRSINPIFIEHRYDQSVLDLLIKRENLKQLKNVCHPHFHPKNIFHHI